MPPNAPTNSNPFETGERKPETGNAPGLQIDTQSEILYGLTRHVLGAVFAGLVTKGYLDSSYAETLTSLALFAVVALWSAFEKSARAARWNAAFGEALTAALPIVEGLQNSSKPIASVAAAACAHSDAPPASDGLAGGLQVLRALPAIIAAAMLCLMPHVFTGCSADDQAAVAAVGSYLASPTTQSALTAVLNTAVDAASGQDVSAVANGISAASLLVRSLQSTPAAASPAAIKTAVTSAGSTAAIAKKVVAAVTTLTKAGATPSAANEAAAEQLDQAVVTLTTSDVPDAVPSAARGATDGATARLTAFRQEYLYLPFPDLRRTPARLDALDYRLRHRNPLPRDEDAPRSLRRDEESIGGIV